MWKRELVLLAGLLFLILQIDYANAVGISPAKRTIDYQPGQTERFNYGIWNTEKSESTIKIEAIGGKLRENIVFSETEINFSAGEMMRQIEGAISFPESTIEQDDFIDIVAKETPKKGAFVNVQLEVKSRIEIKAPPKKEEVKVDEIKNKAEQVQPTPPTKSFGREEKKEEKEMNESELNRLLAGVLIVLAIMQVYLMIYQVSIAKSLKKKKETKSRKRMKKWKKNKRKS